jgi:TolB-like protein
LGGKVENLSERIGARGVDSSSSTDILLFEAFRLDRRNGVLCRRDECGVFAPIDIGLRALDILGALIERPGDVVSRAEMMAAVWPQTAVEDSNLNVQIAALRRVLDKGRTDGTCIQTVPGRGYRFIAEVTRGDPGGTQAAPRLSIVVLPFANLSNDPEQQYFADAITEDLTTDLSRIGGTFVISRNTAFSYQGKRIDTRQISRELGVRYVLEGTVRRSGDHIRINAQLIDARTDAHLWVERFDGDTRDLLTLQDEVTRRIAAGLSLELAAAEAARPTNNPDALDYIFRGRAAYLNPKSRGNYATQVSMYERALALDQRSVEAQSRLAVALTARVLDNMTGSTASDLARAEVLAEKALAASPRSALAHFAKRQVLRVKHRYADAIREYETVLAFNRNWVNAWHCLGQCKLLTGSIAEAIPLAEQAIRLSPRDPELGIFFQLIGRVHLLQSRPQEAILWLEKARADVPTHSNIRTWLAAAFALDDDIERAGAELSEAGRLSSDDRFSSTAKLRGAYYWGVPSIQALHEATYFAGLRKAGMPEE